MQPTRASDDRIRRAPPIRFARAKRLVLLIVGMTAMLAACAHADAIATPPGATSLPTYLAEGSNVVMRFAFERIRSAPFSGQLSAFIANSGTWRVLSAGAGADPVADVDTMVCASRPTYISSSGIYATQWVFVLRHTHEDADVRTRIAAMSQRSGRTTAWSASEGFATTPLPVDPSGFAPHALVLTAPHEIVVAPVDDVPRVGRVAASQQSARRSPTTAVESSLLPETANEVVMIDIRTRESDGATILLPDQSQTARIGHFHLLAERTETGVTIHSVLDFGSDVDARAADEQIRVAVAQLTDTTAARMLGLSRVARALTSQVRGASLLHELALDDRQVGVVLSLVTLSGYGR